MTAHPVRDGEPQIGFYKCRLVKGGPWVAARIWFHRAERDEAGDLLEDEGFRCEVDGKERNPYTTWNWLYSHPVTKAEYDHLISLRQWAQQHSPSDAYADPRKRIDLNDMPTLF